MPIENGLASRVDVVARVLRLRHVLEDVDDLAQATEHQRRLPLPLLGRSLDERAQLVEPSVNQRELILGRARAPPKLPERPLGRREAREKSEAHAAIGIGIVEVMPDPIDRRSWVAAACAANEREIRVVVVFANCAFDEPAERGAVVFKIGQPERGCYPIDVKRSRGIVSAGVQIGIEGDVTGRRPLAHEGMRPEIVSMAGRRWR